MKKFFERHYYCFAIVPPLIVLALGTLLFEICAPAYLSKVMVSLQSLIGETQNLTTHLAEIRARYIWLSTVCFNLVVPIYAIAVCTLIIAQVPVRRQLITLLIIGALLIISGCSILAFEIKSEGAVYRLIYGFAYFSLKHSGHFDVDFINQVRLVISSLNILSFIAPVFVLIAAASILASSGDKNQSNAAQIVIQMRQIKNIINVGSALLVSGIIHTNAWLQWPISLVAEPQIHKAFSEAVMVIVLFWGTTFTLMLFMLAAPSIAYLSNQAHVLSQLELKAGRITDPQKWLKNQGLSHTSGEQFSQVIAILAPLLAGPVGAAIASTLK